MIGCAVANISKIIGNRHNVYHILFIAVLVVSIIVYLYSYDYVPIKQSAYAPIPQAAPHSPLKNGVPAYVYQISNYINSQNGTFSIGTLPTTSPFTNWQVSNWYTGINVYGSLIKSSVYTGSFSTYDEFFSPQIPEKYYHNLSEAIATSPVNYSISNVFSVFGIRYLILQGDTLHYGKSSPTAPIWNESMVYYNLNRSKSIKQAASYNTSSIFEVINYTPLVYSSNVKNVGNSSSSEVFNAIANDTLDVSNTSIYTTRNIGLYNSNGKITVSWISNFKQAGITFDYLSPTKVDARVSNATSPLYLVFRETYDPGWNAYYSNGTAVAQGAHVQVNGFANVWYINKTGNYTMTLYYAPQTLAWETWAISFGALGLTVYVGYLGFAKGKRR